MKENEKKFYLRLRSSSSPKLGNAGSYGSQDTPFKVIH